jgi:hypothetical protein
MEPRWGFWEKVFVILLSLGVIKKVRNTERFRNLYHNLKIVEK